MLCEDKNTSLRVLFADYAGCLDAVHFWHRNVHDDDVGSQFVNAGNGLLPILRLTNHLHVIAT
jgi:hypothetical protein